MFGVCRPQVIPSPSFHLNYKVVTVKNRQLGTERMANKKLEFGTREVAWLLRAHVTLPEDLNMVPSTRISGS